MLKRMFVITCLIIAVSVMLQACSAQQATTSLSVAASLKRIDTQATNIKAILLNDVRPLMGAVEQAKLSKLLNDADTLAAQVRIMASSHDAANLALLAVQARPMVEVGRDLVAQADMIISPVITQLPLAKQIDLRAYRADLSRLGTLIDLIDEAIVSTPEALNWTQVLSDIATITAAVAPLAL